MCKVCPVVVDLCLRSAASMSAAHSDSVCRILLVSVSDSVILRIALMSDVLCVY